MKLAVLNITAGGISGGYRKYLLNFLPRISNNQSIEKTLCALPSSVTLNNISNRYPNIVFISIAPYHFINSKANGELKVILDKFQPDVIYVPVERLFAYENAPVVNMLQNMEPFVRPFFGNPLTEKVKNWARMHNTRKALKNADRIIAISKFVKDYLINKLSINSEKIGLVYHGINKPSGNSKRPVSVPDICKDFLFTAGSIRPARGLEDVFEAMRYLATWKFKIPLVIAGSTDPVMTDYHKKLRERLDKNNLSANVIWAGNLSESEMVWCYKNCSAFIMTSRVESFGQIALEAMSHGCLCISANNPCLPEIFSDSAVYYNSGDGKALYELINVVLSWNQSKKGQFSERALVRASQFSWDICAEKTIEELRKAIQTFNAGGGIRSK